MVIKTNQISYSNVDKAAGYHAKAIDEEVAAEKDADSLVEEKGATEETDGSHAKDRVSKDASEKVAAGIVVATKKLAARENAFEKPIKINRKSSEILLYAPKEALEEKGNVAEEKIVIEGKKAAAEDKVAALIESTSAKE